MAQSCKHKVINRYTGDSVYVNCGHCDSCQYEKSKSLMSRLNHVASRSGYMTLFVTLTYCDECVPFIYSDLHNDISSLRIYSYRPTYKRGETNTYKYSRNWRPSGEPTLLSDICIDTPLYRCDTSVPFATPAFPRIADRYGFYRVGVNYLPDLQNFKKRLRINILRHYGYTDDLFIYSTSHYGTKKRSFRPHFHLLISFKRGWYKEFYDTIIKSWPFCSVYRLKRGIEVAKHAAKYVSRYTSVSNHLPPFYQHPGIRQKRICPSLAGFTFPEGSAKRFIESVIHGVGRYSKTFTDKTSGEPVNRLFVYPKFLRDYFVPRFTGSFRISDTSFLLLCGCPSAALAAAELIPCSLSSVDSSTGLIVHGYNTTIDKLCSLYNNTSNIFRYLFTFSDFQSAIYEIHDYVCKISSSVSTSDRFYRIYQTLSCKLHRFLSLGYSLVDYHLFLTRSRSLFSSLALSNLNVPLSERYYNINEYAANHHVSWAYNCSPVNLYRSDVERQIDNEYHVNDFIYRLIRNNHEC